MRTDKNQVVSFCLRIGLATVFLYAAISAFLDPDSWLGFFPSWLVSLMPASFLLYVYNIYQIILSLWLLSGKKIFYASVLSAITLGLIIIFNITILDIIFRDVAIFLSAVALAVLNRGEEG